MPRRAEQDPFDQEEFDRQMADPLIEMVRPSWSTIPLPKEMIIREMGWMRALEKKAQITPTLANKIKDKNRGSKVDP